MSKKNENDICFTSSENGENNEQKDSTNEKSNDNSSIKEQMQESINDNAIEELILLKQSIDESNEKIDALNKECDDYKNSLIRMKADFENYKKRVREEEKDQIKYANQRLITDMLPILDDFDRAVDAGENIKDVKSFYEGIKLIAKSLHDLLEKKYFITMINEENSNFDPMKHEAVSVIDDPNEFGLKVKEMLQKGYSIESRVLRPAKVIAVRGKKENDDKKRNYDKDASNIKQNHINKKETNIKTTEDENTE